VGDEEIREFEFVLEVRHEVQHLGLYRDVQGLDRLVGDDERRIQRERTRDADALALATGKLVRIAPQRRGVESDTV